MMPTWLLKDLFEERVAIMVEGDKMQDLTACNSAARQLGFADWMAYLEAVR